MNRKPFAWVVLGLAASALWLVPPAPASGAEQSFRLRVGLFTPDGKKDYWRGNEADFTGGPKDLEDVVGGADYIVSLGPATALMFSVDHFNGQTDQEYLNYVDQNGAAIVHTTSLEITPLTAGLMVRLASPRAPIVPYVGVGGGIYAWRLEESGDFIDFSGNNLDIFSADFKADGNAFGYYFLGGIEIPIGNYVSFFAEGRWDRADDKLDQDFAGLGTLDLSGRRITGGIAWRF